MIKLVSTQQAMTLHGDGSCVRDWLHVLDNCDAIWEVLTKGTPGERYNVSAADEWSIKDIALMIYNEVVEALGTKHVYAEPYLTFFHDPRPGCDWRYGVDSTKIRTELGWAPTVDLCEGLHATVRWFLGETV
jgi:dTDP-glucose 4,6-dehydratase